MTPESWRRAGELFHQALDIAPTDRARWIENACEGDAELQLELAALLESDRIAVQGFVRCVWRSARRAGKR